MTARKPWLMLGFAVIMAPALTYGINVQSVMQNANELTVSIKGDKQSYLPGEVISLHFEVKNHSVAPVLLTTPPTVWDSYLRVVIASEGGPFKEYLGPSWGTRDQAWTQNLPSCCPENHSTPTRRFCGIRKLILRI